MRAFTRTVAAVLMVAAAGPAVAQAPELFETHHLAEVDPGSTLHYQVTTVRRDEARTDTTRSDGEITLTAAASERAGARTVQAVLSRDGRSRELDPFRGVSANPVLMIFLEQVVRDVARETGGSPFYLRNRVREALGGAIETSRTGEATSLTLRPFVDDPNKDRFGGLETLELEFVIDPALPGMFRELSARAGSAEDPIFLEEVRFDARS